MGRHGGKRERGVAAITRWLLAGTVAVAGLATLPLRAQTVPSSRVALVIGIGNYGAAPTPAAPDDAGLVAQTLQGAGFDVTAARDLNGDGLRRAFRDFLEKAGSTGPDGIAIVYLAGRAMQVDGDNFFVPVGARLARPADVPIETVRLGDLTHALAALPIQAKLVVVDAAYAGGSAATAPGLALVEAEQGELIAFNAAPGSVAPATRGPYGAYAQALAQGMKQGGVPVSEIFDRVRLSADQASGGAEIPWDSDRLTRSFTFFDRGPDAPAVASAQIPFATLEKRAIRDFPPDQAYDVAVARDTLTAYQDFLAAFPDNPLARRVRLIVSVRREAMFWRATLGGGSPPAFWTYLARYPQGPHAPDARRRLARLAAAAAPPPDFRPLAFDVPPPPSGDVVVFDRPVIFVDPGLPPPPPPPVFLLPPPVVVDLPPPPPSRGPRFLPIPVPVPIAGVRSLVDPGVIALPRGTGGDYGRPRPYRRGPGGDGLVGEDSPERAPPGGSQPPAPPATVRPPPPLGSPASDRPNTPNAPAPQPSRLRPPPSADRPARPATLPPPAGRPGRPPGDGVAPGRPALPPAMPGAEPAPAGEPRTVPARGAGPPPPRPGRPVQAPADQAPQRPARPLPGAAPSPEPAPAGIPPRPSRSSGQPDIGPGAPRRSLPRLDAEPRPEGGPAPRPVQDGESRPAAPRRSESGAPAGAPPDMRPGAQHPPSSGGGQPPEAGRGPGGAGGPRHPACGQPGEPPCH